MPEAPYRSPSERNRVAHAEAMDASRELLARFQAKVAGLRSTAPTHHIEVVVESPGGRARVWKVVEGWEFGIRREGSWAEHYFLLPTGNVATGELVDTATARVPKWQYKFKLNLERVKLLDERGLVPQVWNNNPHHPREA